MPHMHDVYTFPNEYLSRSHYVIVSLTRPPQTKICSTTELECVYVCKYTKRA